MEVNEHEHSGILTEEQAEAIRNKHLTPAHVRCYSIGRLAAWYVPQFSLHVSFPR
jgi:hypothetical protein